MKVREWEIWFDYYSYYKSHSIDLDLSADLIINSGVSSCVMHSNGKTYIKTKNGIVNGMTTIEMSSDSKNAKIGLDLDDDIELDLGSFAAECWYQAAYLRFNELRIMGQNVSVPSEYIRFFLGEIDLRTEDGQREINCYPIVKLYETGVILVEFRTLSPNRDIELADFINDYVNLSHYPFEKVLVCPQLSKYATRAYYHGKRPKVPLKTRIVLNYMFSKNDEVIDSLSELVKGEDYEFQMAPLSNEKYDTLSSIALTIFDSIGYIISKPIEGFEYIIRGQKNLHRVGGYWEGKPNVYLIDFSSQCKTAEENESVNQVEFGQILSRSMVEESKAKQFLVEDRRIFNDYNVYLGLGITLWVWSLHGKEYQSEHYDINNGHLIYEPQIESEFIEYGYMLHRSLYEKCSSYDKVYDVLELKEFLIQLEYSLNKSSHYGEVRELFKYGWKQMGMIDLKKAIDEKIQVKEAQSVYFDSKRNNYYAIALTILFGFISVPQLADSILSPLWTVLDLPIPLGKEEGELFLIGIATLIIGSIIGLVYGRIRKIR